MLPIFAYDAIEDAIAAANPTEFGLTASVWSVDDELADRVTAQLITGMVRVNCHGMTAQDPRVPFGVSVCRVSAVSSASREFAPLPSPGMSGNPRPAEHIAEELSENGWNRAHRRAHRSHFESRPTAWSDGLLNLLFLHK